MLHVCRTSKLVSMVVFLAAALAPLVAFGQDTTPPQLTALTITPSTVDVTNASANFTVNFTATDDASGVAYFETSLLDPNGTVVVGANTSFGGLLSATGSVTLTVPQGSVAGTYTIGAVYIQDAAGNGALITPDMLTSYTISVTVTNANSDTTAPTLTALSFGSTVNVVSAAATLTVNFTATDDASGVKSFQIGFVSPSGGTNLIGTFTATTPTLSVTNSATVTFPQGVEGGTWTVGAIAVSDAAGNTQLLETTALTGLSFPTTLTVTSNTDTTNPVLTALSITPGSIDTSSSSASVTVNFSATDDLSGVKNFEVSFTSPSGGSVVRAVKSVTPATSVTSSAIASFPILSEVGTWSVSVSLSDAAGNTLSLTPSALSGLSFPNALTVAATADTTAPSLTAFSFSPSTITVITTSAPVTVAFQATDDLSGVTTFQASFVSPSGTGIMKAIGSFTKSTSVSSTAMITFPAGSEDGVWTVASVLLSDAAGNVLRLATSDLVGRSLPTTLTVHSTPPAPVATAQTQSATSAVGAMFTLNASDPDGFALIYHQTAAPSNGMVSVTCTTSCSATYTSNSSFVGMDSFSYYVTNQAAGVSSTVTVTINVKVALTVTPSGTTRAYGAANVLGYTITGFLGSDTIAVVSGTPMLSTTATATSAPGSYPVTAMLGSLTATNYTFTFASGTITVTQAPLTVTASGTDRAYGSANMLGSTITGFANSETSSVLSGSPMLSTTATATSAPGSYPVTAALGSLSSTNYSFSFAPGTFMVTQATLTVTASGATRAYGSANSLSYTITGFANSETSSVITGTPMLSTTATATSVPGSYPVTAALGSLSSTNYSFSFVPGTLTVTQAVLTVTPSGTTRVYGAGNSLSYSITGFLNTDTLSVVSGTPMLSTTATATSAPGSYPVTAMVGSLTATDYSFTFASGTISVTQAPLTVTSSGATRAYGAANSLSYMITGFANSETSSVLSGTPMLSTTATATSAPGSYPVTAALGSLSSINYSFSFTPGTLMVTQATLTVTASGTTRAYGAANSLSYTITGFANSETSSVLTGTPMLSTTATATSAPGSYPVTAVLGSLSSTNYSFSFVPGTLTVTQAVLTVTPSGTTRVYGAANSLSYSITGFLNTDTISVVTGTPMLSTTATATSAPGSYPVTAALGSLSSTNYSFSFTPGTLMVTQATLTVTASGTTRVYGAANSLSYTVTGFANSETSSVLTGTPMLSTTATATSAPGSYPVTAALGSLSSINYSFSFTPGTFMVTQAPLTVTASGATRAYGSANSLTYTITGFANSETSAVLTGTPMLNTTATVTSSPGSYPVTVALGTLSSTNYSFGFVPGTLTVLQATLTVTAGSGTRAYGAANSLSYSITGFLNADTIAVVSGAPLVGTTASSTSVPGVYPVTATLGSLSATNYQFAFVAGTVTVTQAATTLALTTITPGITAPAGQTFNLTVSLLAVPGGVAPSGAVAYTVDAGASQSAPASNGVAMIAISGLTVGAHSVRFSYAGDTNYLAVAQSTTTLTVTQAAGQLTISAGLSASQPFGQSFTLTFTLASGPTAPTGTISYSVDGGSVQSFVVTSTLPTATLANLAVGTHTVTASYSGDANFAASTAPALTLTVTKITTQLAITAAPGVTQSVGQSFTLTFGLTKGSVAATAPTGTVSYTVDGGAPQSVTVGSNAITAALGTLAAGTHTVTASYSGDANYAAATAQALTLTVTKITTQLAVAVTPSAAQSFGQGFTLTFGLTTASTAGAATGTISYTVDGGAAQSITLGSGTPAATLSNLSVGTHTVTASYSGDASYQSATSTAVTLTVGESSGPLSVTASPDIAAPLGTSFTLTIAPSATTGATPPTGTITYTVDGGAAQSIALSAGKAAITLASLALGAHTVTASYGGDANYLAATASTTTLTVLSPPAINNGGVLGTAGYTISIGPGGIASLFGSNLAGSIVSAASLPLPTTLAGVQVTVNGTASPLFYVSPTQINFLVPSATPIGKPVAVVVVLDGVPGPPLTVTLAGLVSIFTYQRTATATDPVIVHADNSLVTPASPAKAGEILVVYASGSIPLVNAPADGAPALASPPATTVSTPTITVGGAATTVQYSGLTPGSVGLLQFNIQLPATLPAGSGTPPTLPLVVVFPGASSAPVNLWVSK